MVGGTGHGGLVSGARRPRRPPVPGRHGTGLMRAAGPGDLGSEPVSGTTGLLVPGPGEGRRGRGLLFGGVWLLFLIAPVSEALSLHPGVLARALIVAVTVVFCL